MPKRQEVEELDAYDLREQESAYAAEQLAPGGEYYKNDTQPVKKASTPPKLLVEDDENEDLVSAAEDETQDEVEADNLQEEDTLDDVLDEKQVQEHLKESQQGHYQLEIEKEKQALAQIEAQERGFIESWRIMEANQAQVQENIQLSLGADDSAAAAQYMKMLSELAQEKANLELAYTQLQHYKQQLSTQDAILSNATYIREKERFSRLVDYDDLSEHARGRLEKVADNLAQMYDPRDKKFWKTFAAKARAMGLAPSGPQDGYHENNPNYTNRTRSDRMNKPRGGPPVSARSSGKQAPLSSEAIRLGAQREQALRSAGYEPGDPEWKRMAASYARWDKEHAKQ